MLAPRRRRGQQFSEQFPETVGELERLPLVGGWIGEQDLVDAPAMGRRAARAVHRRTGRRVGTVVAQRRVGVAIVAVVASPCSSTARTCSPASVGCSAPQRRAQADEVGRVVYRTLGRYFGGSLTVAILMGLYVLALGLVLGVPLAPLAAVWAMLTDLIPQVGGFLGGVVFVAPGADPERADGADRRGLFVLYMTLENHVIQPAIVGRSVDLTPPTTMVAARQSPYPGPPSHPPPPNTCRRPRRLIPEPPSPPMAPQNTCPRLKAGGPAFTPGLD